MMTVNVSLIRLILICGHEHNSKRELLRQPYLRGAIENIPKIRLRIPVYDGINDSTVTDANTQRTHLTERRTQAIAQKNLVWALQDLWEQTRTHRKQTTVRQNYGNRTGATANQIHKLRPLSYVTRDV